MCLRGVGENPTLQKESNSTTNWTLYNYNQKATQITGRKVRGDTFRQFLHKTDAFALSVKTKYYSTLTNGENFYQWFVGFADAESSFSIVPKSDKIRGNINRFSFMFKIALHKDDKDALIRIQTNLGFGKVSLDKDECKFVVTKQEDINKLILILDKYNLNTTKYLDYINLKKAFLLYHGRDGLVTPELIAQILELKNGMNTSRTDFNMPSNHNIIISKNWLLGLIEGEGSFQLWRNDIAPVFGLVLTEKQLPLFPAGTSRSPLGRPASQGEEKIKEYLINNMGFDSYSKYKLANSSAITINHQKARNNSKGSVLLLIKNIHILHNYFLPFLGDLNFFTKKYNDYKDFKIICKAVYLGAHKQFEIKPLILKLSLTMNNYRLSTNCGKVEDLSKLEMDTLLNISPSIEHLSDGRQRDVITGKIVHQHTSCVYEIVNKSSGEIILKLTLSDAAQAIGIDIKTLSKYLYIEVTKSVEVKDYMVRRVGVFTLYNTHGTKHK
uniref:LAGLIDADG endonuclease n=1 Tax=Juglanconis juglandina TaxID=1940567 RepID=A0A291LIU9_9PEZI|nr:LAGLIDADG endonuclease [Juglanconis juglandina]